MQLVDTHCHIHFPDYELDPEEVIEAAKKDGVTKLLCVGCTLPDSKRGIEFAKRYENIWASVGLHPHEGSEYVNDDQALQEFRSLLEKPKVVAVGETGLDYYYENSPKEHQKELFRFQLTLAQEFDLPLIFHVRDAFTDFFEVVDEFKGVRGVVHSFTAHQKELDEVLKRGFYVGLNGIMTFTKDEKQLETAKSVPIDKLLLETDAPFLTPKPYRGTICEPKHALVTANFLAKIRGESLEKLAKQTTKNAKELFGIN